jgi:hypothetical protein
MDPQSLTNEPQQHPDSCISLSRSLLEQLASEMPSSTASILSIGSGPGLLEALLQAYLDRELASLHHTRAESCDIYGLEVLSATINPNKYLPEENMHFVRGAWELCPAAARAAVWLFVYPRDPKLVQRYTETYGEADRMVQKIIWLGPSADWEDYRDILAGWSQHRLAVFRGAECGIADFEMMAVADRRSSAD